MLCQMCRSKDVRELKTVNVKNGVIQAYLCSDCEKRVTSQNIFNEKYSNDFWTGEIRETKCEVCKTSLSDFEETGYVGCENCYKTFEYEISKKLLEINGKNIYVGKIPENLLNKISRSSEVKKLRQKLEESTIKGDFISAKNIQAQILKIGGDFND